MPKTHIARSITINTGANKVKNIVSDFKHWRAWSPWLMLEPEAIVTVTDNGKKQRWEGKRVGTGEMTVLEEKASAIHYDLTFLKPWKSKASVDFFIEPESAKTTKVTWTMDGSLPFFMFWMKNLMERMLGMDYDRGLQMLKDYIEKDEVEAKLEFLGESDYAGCKYVGLKNSCTIDGLGKTMSDDVNKLNAYTKEISDKLLMEFFTVYHKFDFGKNHVEYTVGIGVKEPQDDLPNRFFNGNLPATKVYTVRHIGRYELLGNAWSALMSMDRAKEIRKNKKLHPIEFYRNNPADTAPKDLITDISMPVK